MSTPAAKRRRINDASKILSKPFRSPFKTPFKSPVKAGDPPLKSSTTPSVNPPYLHSQSPNLLSTPNAATRKGVGRTFSSPVSTAVLNADPAIAPLLKKQRELEKELKRLKEDLDTAEQAAKIEKAERGQDGDIDGELRVLAGKWKEASRQASEELFGRVRDRVNRMGGPRAWKEMQKKQAEGQSRWGEVEPMIDDEDSDDDEIDKEAKRKRKRELAEEMDIDVETENEKSQRAKGVGDTGERAGEEDEFTMAMMLRTLNVDLDVIGYDREQQRWVD